MSHRCYIYKHFVFFRCHRHYTFIFHVISELCRLLLLHHSNISFYPPYLISRNASRVFSERLLNNIYRTPDSNVMAGKRK